MLYDFELVGNQKWTEIQGWSATWMKHLGNSQSQLNEELKLHAG
jgi:hypothetical protein